MKKIIALVVSLMFVSAVGFAAAADTKPAKTDNATSAPAEKPKAKKKQMQGC